MTETQLRFLHAVAERVGADRIVEVRLFPPIRQSGVESGVAIIAAERHVAAHALPEEEAVSPLVADEPFTPDAEADASPAASGDVSASSPNDPEPYAPVASPDDSPYADAGEPTLDARRSTLDARAPDPDGETGDHNAPPHRFEFLSARYRLTLKGMDRGKWEFDIVHEADAPLDTVERVVRGVQRRTGDLVEPEQLAGHAFRHALDAPSWTVTT